MSGTHNYWLVLLSIVVAITASFVSLELAARVADPYRRAARRPWWLAGGALAIGTGIWSMHFIGMLGFTLPVEVSYDVPITLLSLAIAIGAAAFALVVATRDTQSRRGLAASGLLMGIAIAGMHYTGMAALRMDPPIRYGPALFGLSLLIAVAGSLIALWSAFRLRLETLASALWKKAGSALVMARRSSACITPPCTQRGSRPAAFPGRARRKSTSRGLPRHWAHPRWRS